MRFRSLGTTILVIAVVTPSVIHAQGVQRPQRAYRGLFGGGPPPDPNRSRQELTLATSVVGGYDDVVSPEASGSLAPQTGQSGYTGFADAELRYWRGHQARSFELNARGFSNAFGGVVADPSFGGSGRIRAMTNVGSRSQIDLSQDLRYEPFLVLGAYDALQGSVDPALLPDSNPTQGFISQRSWSSSSTARFSRRWSRRHNANATYTFNRREYLDDFGNDSRTHTAGLEYGWSFSRNARLRSSYQYSDGQFEGEGSNASTSLLDQTVEVGLAHERRLSPTRRAAWSIGAGGTYVRHPVSGTRPAAEYWIPSGSATARIDMGRSWALAADYRRALTVLEGITLESFTSDTASIRVDGLLGRRYDAAFVVGFANGRASLLSQHTGSYETYSGSIQLRTALARCCAALVNYSYYYHRLRDVPDLPPGLSSEFDRGALRVGFNVWLPLYGSYSDGSRRPRGRN